MRVHLAIHHSWLTITESLSSDVARKLVARIILHAAVMAW
jgi:hypothetical protein